MHWRITDYTGQQFKYFKVLYYIHSKGKNSKWLCLCDCGNLFETTATNIRRREGLSCGCHYGDTHIKHGVARKNYRLYKIYAGIIDRCRNPTNNNYKNYGGRGIDICEAWSNNINAFYDWAISNGYNKNLSIDRIDVNGNYEPSNCRWVDMKTQGNNRRNTVYLDFGGICLPTTKVMQLTGHCRNWCYKHYKKVNIM